MHIPHEARLLELGAIGGIAFNLGPWNIGCFSENDSGMIQYVYTYIYTYIYVFLYIYMYVCVCDMSKMYNMYNMYNMYKM